MSINKIKYLLPLSFFIIPIVPPVYRTKTLLIEVTSSRRDAIDVVLESLLKIDIFFFISNIFPRLETNFCPFSFPPTCLLYFPLQQKRKPRKKKNWWVHTPQSRGKKYVFLRSQWKPFLMRTAAVRGGKQPRNVVAAPLLPHTFFRFPHVNEFQ